MRGSLRLVRLFSFLVPRGRRREWREEWEGELWAYEQRGARESQSRARSALFVAGALPHAIAELTASWTPDLLMRDLRYALRSLVRSRGFAIMAILLLVAGVCSTATVFSIVNAVLFRVPEGVGNADALVQIGRGNDSHEFDNWSYPMYRDFLAARTLEDAAAYAGRTAVIGAAEGSEEVAIQIVSPNYFDVLQARVARGRTFAETPDREVVISDALWRRRFAGMPDVLGRTIEIAGEPYAIIGVAHPGFYGADIGAPPPALWLPLGQHELLGGYDRLDSRNVSWLWVVARMRPGAATEALRAELTGMLRAAEADIPLEHKSHIALDAGLRIRPEDRVLAERISALMMGGVLLVLLIACSNLAALLLARGAARRGELGVRLALGASRARVVRQLIVESIVIALVGSTLAFALTHWTATLVTRVFPYELAPSFRPDWRVLLFALAIGVVTTIAFSLLPALQAVRVDVARTMQGASTRVSRSQGPLRVALVVTQIALSFALLVGTTLLLRTLTQAMTRAPGFRTEGLLVGDLRFTILNDSARTAARAQIDAVVTRLASVQGIERISYSTRIPSTLGQSNRAVWRTDAPPVSDRPPIAYYSAVDTGYFKTAGIVLRRGRAFDLRDGVAAPKVVIISELLARQLWGADDPLGKQLSHGSVDGEIVLQVVGVAADIRNRSLRQPPAAHMYLPLAQSEFARVTLQIDARSQAAEMRTAVIEAVRAAAPDLPTVQVQPIEQRLGSSLADVRLIALMGSVFGGIALLLALSGLYGVVSYAAAQRSKEFAVRLALGAAPRDIAGLVMRQAALLIAGGITVGFGAALLIRQSLRSMLFGVSSLDPISFGSVALLLAFTAGVASLLPALRSTRVQPISNLRPD